MLLICEYAIAYFAKTGISHIFPQIMAFSKCKNYAAYPKICIYSHICRIFPHMRSHFSAFFLSNVVLKPLNILAANDYRYLQLHIEEIKSKMSKMCRIGLLMIMIMILRHLKLHMPEICGKICCIYAAYVAYMPHICAAYFAKFRIFSRIFCLKKFHIF